MRNLLFSLHQNPQKWKKKQGVRDALEVANSDGGAGESAAAGAAAAWTGPLEDDPTYRLLVECNALAVDIDAEVAVCHNFVRDRWVAGTGRAPCTLPWTFRPSLSYNRPPKHRLAGPRECHNLVQGFRPKLRCPGLPPNPALHRPCAVRPAPRYKLRFPELESLVHNPVDYARVVRAIGACALLCGLSRSLGLAAVQHDLVDYVRVVRAIGASFVARCLHFSPQGLQPGGSSQDLRLASSSLLTVRACSATPPQCPTGNEADVTLVDLEHVLPPAAVMVVTVTATTTSGRPLPQEQLEKVRVC